MLEGRLGGEARLLDEPDYALIAAVCPNALVPIHTFEAQRFPKLFENVVLRDDGEWWEV